MSVVAPVTTPSLRRHPELQAIFKAAESRQMTEQELDEYCRVVPEHKNRADAAREVARIEQEVVSAITDEILAVYPFEQYYQYSQVKINRDVRYTSAYATEAMLMQDAAWLDEKLLVWLRTILLAFEFPDRVQKKKVLFAKQTTDSQIEQLPVPMRSVYETYYKLKQRYQEMLSPSAYALMEPYLQQILNTLTEQY